MRDLSNFLAALQPQWWCSIYVAADANPLGRYRELSKFFVSEIGVELEREAAADL